MREEPSKTLLPARPHSRHARRVELTRATAVLILALSPGFPGLAAAAAAAPQSSAHVMVPPEAIVWRGEPTGVQTAVVEGDPRADALFTMMLRLPDGAWIPPHFHNVEKRLVVIGGELLMGHGDVIDASKTTALASGGVAVVPAGTRHYEGGKGLTIVALTARGPFRTTMVGSSR